MDDYIESWNMRADDDGMYPASVLMFTALTNETEGHRFSDITEQMPATDKPSFRDLQREWGRCRSKVYIDTVDGVKHVGYFFESKQRYDDTRDHYIRGAWVTFSTLPPLDYLPRSTWELRHLKGIMQ